MSTVWIAGATGLVGRELLRTVLEDPSFDPTVAVGRRRLDLTHERLVQAQVDFADAKSFEKLPTPEIAFCSLGTTIKKAGSREAFRAVDYDAVLTFAKAARQRGARTFLHVTALGASPRSMSFYSSVKGEVEQAVENLGFERCVAFRPSLLDGAREERRTLEHAGLIVARVLAPVLGRYRPTPAASVARAMVHAAKKLAPVIEVVESGAILAAGSKA